MTLKAYAVLEDCENTGGIIFAEHNIVARRVGAQEYGDGDFSAVTCRRAPWADRFAETGIVPAKVMVDEGWHFECFGCDRRIDAYSLEERRLPVSGVIGSQNGCTYCGKKCFRRHQRIVARRREEEAKAIEPFQSIVLKRFPDVEFEDRQHAYVTRPERGGPWDWTEIVVSFRFPGMVHGAAHFSLRRGYMRTEMHGPVRPVFTCCNGDREAFEAWVSGSAVPA